MAWDAWVVGWLTRRLPGVRSRTRYHQELTSELAGRTRRERLALLLGFALRLRSLRRELGAARPLSCVLGRHDWHVFSTDDGSPYRACARCGKEHPELGSAPALPMQYPEPRRRYS